MRPPDRISGNISAWRFNLESIGPKANACLRQWLISGPFHPFWNNWIISAVTLKDIPGMPQARKAYKDAEYEISIISLNPDFPVEVDAIENGTGHFHHLEPVDFTIQFDGIHKEYVIGLVDIMVDMIITGQASPDSDYRNYWDIFVRTKIQIFKKREA